MEKKRKILLGATVIILIFSLVFFLASRKEQNLQNKQAEEQPQTASTKQEITHMLSAPGQGNATEKEKQEIVNSLSAPQQ